MKKRNILSAVVFILAVSVAIAVYFVVFDKFDRVWLEILPMMYLFLGTFIAALGVYISANLLEVHSIQVEVTEDENTKIETV